MLGRSLRRTVARGGMCRSGRFLSALLSAQVASQRAYSLRRLGDGAAGLVVEDHRCVEPANLRLRAVELFHSRLPFTVVDGFGGGARFP